MEELPLSKSTPTIISCLIAQIKLAKISNSVQAELLTHHRPIYENAIELEDISLWSKDLPSYSDQNISVEPHLELPKRVLIWRSFHLRIVLNRPFLFEAIATNAEINLCPGPIHSCLIAADECVLSICEFMKSTNHSKRGFAWYATYWLTTAAFIQATCLIYTPIHSLALGWKVSLQQAVVCLEGLGTSHEIALRARSILRKILEQGHRPDLASEPPTAAPRPLNFPWAEAPGSGAEALCNYPSISLEDNFGWFPMDRRMPSSLTRQVASWLIDSLVSQMRIPDNGNASQINGAFALTRVKVSVYSHNPLLIGVDDEQVLRTYIFEISFLNIGRNWLKLDRGIY